MIVSLGMLMGIGSVSQASTKPRGRVMSVMMALSAIRMLGAYIHPGGSGSLL